MQGCPGSTIADIYTSESVVVQQVSFSPPRNLTVEVIAPVTGIESCTCVAPKAVHAINATTVAGHPGTVMFIVALAQDYPGALDAGVIDQLVATLRSARPA